MALRRIRDWQVALFTTGVQEFDIYTPSVGKIGTLKPGGIRALKLMVLDVDKGSNQSQSIKFILQRDIDALGGLVNKAQMGWDMVFADTITSANLLKISPSAAMYNFLKLKKGSINFQESGANQPQIVSSGGSVQFSNGTDTYAGSLLMSELVREGIEIPTEGLTFVESVVNDDLVVTYRKTNGTQSASMRALLYRDIVVDEV